MLDSLTGVTSVTVRAALDALALQQRVSADNIANANTGGFTARRVEFESALRAVEDSNSAPDVAKERLRAIGAGIAAGDYIRSADGPGVQLDLELARLNETVLKYQALLQGLSQSGSMTRMAVTGDVR